MIGVRNKYTSVGGVSLYLTGSLMLATPSAMCSAKLATSEILTRALEVA